MVERGEWRGTTLSATSAGPDIVLHRPCGERSTLRRALEAAVAAEPDLAGGQPAICDLIERGLRDRTPARVLARELRTLVHLDTQRSIDLVSYLLQRQAAELSSERAYQAGLGPRFEWVWGGNLDDPSHHKARSGKVFDWNDPVFDGKPIPRNDLPGMARLCGCRAKFILQLDEDDV